jgi:hypothetical protein
MKSKRLLFQLRGSTHLTKGKDFGLLPTPACMQMDYQPKEGWTWEGSYWRDENGKKKQTDLASSVKMLPTPTVMDSSKDGDMTAAAKIMKGATHRSSGQQIQKTLTDVVQMEYLKMNPELAEELANKPMMKRTNLPNQQEFVKWIRQTTSKKLSKITKIPLTKVEHWFRQTVKGFSHPTIEDWNIMKHHLENWNQWDYQLTFQESIQWTGMLPTPRVKGHGNSHQRIEEGKMDDLTTLAKMGMLPTPIVSDWKGSAGPSENLKGKSDLAVQAHEICGIPRGTTSQLNPLFVAEMMGFPTDWTILPFQSGETKASRDTEMP